MRGLFGWGATKMFGRDAANVVPVFRDDLPSSDPASPTIVELPQMLAVKKFLSSWTSGPDSEWILGIVRAAESGREPR